MRQWIAALLLLVTIEQLKTAECRVACGYTGYDSGAHWNGKCYCADILDYYELTNRKRIILSKKAKTNLVPSSYSDPPKEKEPELHRGYPKELDDYLF